MKKFRMSQAFSGKTREFTWTYSLVLLTTGPLLLTAVLHLLGVGSRQRRWQALSAGSDLGGGS